MRHARVEALDALEPLLGRLRAFAALKERSRGVFYVKSQAFLHFHEDPAGLFADVRPGVDWDRMPVNDAMDHVRLIVTVDRALAE